jgi:hypothetical protein
MPGASEFQLPEDGPVDVGGVSLPAGHRVRGSLPPTSGDPVMWVTGTPIESPGSLWSDLDIAARNVGLLAVLLDDLRGPEGRPWDTGEFVRIDDPAPERYDPDVIFRRRWNWQVPIGSLAPEDRNEMERERSASSLPPWPDWLGVGDEDPEETAMFLEQVAPWGIQFPGLALAESAPEDSSRYDSVIRETPAARVGLVAASRPADIPAVIGWAGAINDFHGDEGAVILSAMMRSWEDRFGARLFRLGFDTMEFLVERPPATLASAEAVAAEHFSFAGTDGLNDQGLNTPEEPVTTIRSLARLLLGNPIWHFWWD